ncbi:helix-turn-helix domain-containing protein, partial [Klebsiella quasipneumoniae]|uniref:helix-turn-helix domain-containing protein n=2 Tax=Klebsiella quasipneumoniae TaxID=1463165 RepID=UPI001D0D8256
GKNSLNRLIRCVCGKKIGPDPRNFNQRVSLGRNDLLIRTFPSFQTIKSMLSRYLYRAEIDGGQHESLSAFIIKRTNLSRSYVYQVLAALREGGYITVKKGKLISIDRSIPEKF